MRACFHSLSNIQYMHTGKSHVEKGGTYREQSPKDLETAPIM